MSKPLPPLPKDIEALLRRAERPAPSAELADRVYDRLAQTVTSPAFQASQPLPKLGSWGVPVAVISLMLGGAAGFLAGTRLAWSPPVSEVPAPREATAPAALKIASVPIVEEAPPSVRDQRFKRGPKRAVEPPSASAVPARPAEGRDVQLSEERGLLEIARTALSRRDFDGAFAQLDLHARRHPHGQLAEERESLRIHALISAGRLTEAKAHGELFMRNHPRSMLLPAVRAALRSSDAPGPSVGSGVTPNGRPRSD